MALHIYETVTSSPFSEDGAMTNPIRHAFDGSKGGVEEVRYYIRNDDGTKVYTDIIITPVDFTGASIIDGTDGYSIKLSAGNTQPTSIQWNAIEAGAGINMPDLGVLTPVFAANIATYNPFWVRMEIPRGADVETFDDVVFRIEATENP